MTDSTPLSVAGVAALRAQGTPVPLGVAPATSSDMFKSAVCDSIGLACGRCANVDWSIALLHEAKGEAVGS